MGKDRAPKVDAKAAKKDAAKQDAPAQQKGGAKPADANAKGKK